GEQVERMRMRIASRRDSVLAAAVLSHVSAVLIHRLDPIVTGTEAVELTRSAYSRTYSDLRLYARELVDADIDPAHSYPVTTLARTLADVALDHSLEVSAPLISQALHD